MWHLDYDDYFVQYLEENLGVMFEHGHNNGLSLEQIWNLFLNSGVAKQIEIGNYQYLTCSGEDYLIEMFKNKEWKHNDLHLRFDQYYWLGSVIADYQQKYRCKFSYLTKYMTIRELFDSYYPLHEADISKFIDFVNDTISRRKKYTHLAELRRANKLSRSQLAKRANVSLKLIQMFEQKHLDINKAKLIILCRFAQVLHCDIEDLIE